MVNMLKLIQRKKLATSLGRFVFIVFGRLLAFCSLSGMFIKASGHGSSSVSSPGNLTVGQEINTSAQSLPRDYNILLILCMCQIYSLNCILVTL